ncbi:hypothetical protein chiPu_0022822, partial [Chiloscyllium punctatum]|nr:hypothetical protein [Chiloscyllium punctatum]
MGERGRWMEDGRGHSRDSENGVCQSVKPPDESRSIGRISKQWSGIAKEVLTDADNFGVQFPMDLNVKLKASLIGACFLIDFMFFERGKSRKQRDGVW